MCYRVQIKQENTKYDRRACPESRVWSKRLKVLSKKVKERDPTQCNNKTYRISADRNKTFRGEKQFVCYDCGTGACGAAIRVQSWE